MRGTGLALIGTVLAAGAVGGCASRPVPWTSQARFTISQVGTYTAADSTVPIGIHGNAELDLGMGLAANRTDFVSTIGDDPDDDTNVSQWELIFRGYHGPGGYTVAPGSGNGTELRVMVRDRSGNTDTWGSDQSKTAGCTVHVTADQAMADPTIREVRGRVTCHGLWDAKRRTATTSLSGRFDVFAEVWCGAEPRGPACRSPQPLPEAPRD